MACKHCTSQLPRGLKCDRGYLFLTIRWNKKTVPKPYCGVHTRGSEVLAKERLSKIRSEIERGRFGFEPELPEKTFEEVVPIFLKHWEDERHDDLTPVHNARSIKECRLAIKRNLLPYFGKMKFHEIKAVDVERRRTLRLTGVKDPNNPWEYLVEPVLGTTVNREHVPLGSIFTKIAKLIELGTIEPFKIPVKNPCEAATKAEMRVHGRELSDYEITKLRLACFNENDSDAWEICKLILTSTLSVGDTKKLEIGKTIDIKRGKTGTPINLPIMLMQKLNWENWPVRWRKIRLSAGFVVDKKSQEYVDAKVLRKTAINRIRRKLGVEAAAKFAAHSVKTNDVHYKNIIMEENKPAADYLNQWMSQLENGGDGGI